MTGTALKAARDQLGLGNTELASMLGVSVRTLEAYLYGARPIPAAIKSTMETLHREEEGLIGAFLLWVQDMQRQEPGAVWQAGDAHKAAIMAAADRLSMQRVGRAGKGEAHE